MTIELCDMDVPYEVQIDCNAEGKDFIRIKPNSAKYNREEDEYDLDLDYYGCQELIRVLQFVSKEIKPKK